MARDFRLPDLGEGVHEGQIVRVHVKEGDVVREDQPLLEVETDKAAVEIPCPFTGRVSKVHVSDAQLVHVGEVMVSFDDDGATEPAGRTTRSAAAAASGPAGRAGVAAVARSAAPRRAGGIKPASPAVRKLARTLGVDLNAVEGSGSSGRVTRDDVERAARAEPAPMTTPARPAARQPSAPAPSPVAPAAAPRLAPADLATTPGTSGEDAWGPVSHEPISRVRATIAANMSRSWTEIPHVTDSFDADVTELDRLRRQHNGRRSDAPKLTMLPFVVRAVAMTLRRHPMLNASWDAEHDRIVYRRYVSIAVGVHSERGLVAPVLRDADRLGIEAIAGHLHEIIEKARTATFAVDDLRGGTFTISNPGAMGGSRYSTPIINPPQAAVLAIGRSGWQPAVVDGEIVPRYLMPMSLSFDHRLIDGGTELAFQNDLVATLEQPVRLML